MASVSDRNEREYCHDDQAFSQHHILNPCSQPMPKDSGLCTVFAANAAPATKEILVVSVSISRDWLSRSARSKDVWQWRQEIVHSVLLAM